VCLTVTRAMTIDAQFIKNVAKDKCLVFGVTQQMLLRIIEFPTESS